MQRKNSILSSSSKSRSGMALIMAIAVIVIISTIMALSLSLTANTSKRTTDLYLYEQSVLLSKSATEYAILQISQNSPCSYTGGSFTYDTLYDINISVSYIYDNTSYCSANGGTQYATVQTAEQSGSALIDVTVGVNDSTITTEPIRYFRRSIQKL
jgi:Tfp pilus assembly protein PilX